MPMYTHPKQPTSALLVVVNPPPSPPLFPSSSTAKYSGQKFIISKPTALLWTSKSHYVKVCDWMWCQASWVRSAMGVMQTVEWLQAFLFHLYIQWTVTRHTCQHTAVRSPAAQHMSMQWHTSGMAARDMIHAMHTPCCDGPDDSVLGGISSWVCGTPEDGGGAGGGGGEVTLERAGTANKEWRYVHQGRRKILGQSLTEC